MSIQTIAIAICLLGLINFTMQRPAGADENLNSRVRFNVQMSCAALARIHAADYPEAVRIYSEGQSAKTLEEADRAALGLMWRHRHSIAQTLAISAYSEWVGRLPTEETLGDEQSRWVRTLMGYPMALREAVATNCEPLYMLADRSCSSRAINWSP
ncbi:MAG: hypothetical protein VBE63_20300 [Lamprobacter sp.]|uniref:hypothetical protein n=1 Tax=Lamprobacter sp. TaxID=3100796 RepID=UPI002B2577AB|nr:hypothetical protein [Lamprobacter sp.]MEA3642260.1 hypothetical protein [Lamprobacter sp.]